jgi:3D (Asp-Asp-Asp) domain-containing protein
MTVNLTTKPNTTIELETTSKKYVTVSKRDDNDDRIYLGKYKLTAYCPCSECSGSWGRQTSTGATATEGRTIGVDPGVIKYGTEVYIDGVGKRVAEDTGGAVNNKHIDIFMDSHADCLRFGVKYADVYMIEEN